MLRVSSGRVVPLPKPRLLGSRVHWKVRLIVHLVSGLPNSLPTGRRNQRKVRLFVQFLPVRVFEASHRAQRTSPCAVILSKAVLA